MTLAVLTVTAAQLLDLGTFVRMIWAHGAAAEANPLVSHLVVEHGLLLPVVAKVVALSLVVAVTVVLDGRSARPERTGHPHLARTVVAVAIIAGLLGGWTNAALLI